MRRLGTTMTLATAHANLDPPPNDARAAAWMRNPGVDGAGATEVHDA